MPSSPLSSWEGHFSFFLTFAKAGGTAIAGSYATIRPLRRALVTQNAWLTEEAFDRAVSLAQTLPGVFGLNLAAYLGHLIGGFRGAVLALIAMLLPPFFVVLIVASFFNDLRESPAMAAFLRGARPAVIALMVAPFWQIMRRAKINISTIWIPIGAALAIVFLGISPVYIVVAFVIGAALYGWLVRTNE